MEVNPRGAFDKGLSELAERCAGRLTTDWEECDRFSRDFGGFVLRRPLAILKPNGVDDVSLAMSIAANYGLPVATRGAGHSQSGQGLGEGLVIDMRHCDRILGVSDRENLVEVEAGARWKDVLDATFLHGRLPVGPTHVVDTTVGGTLSVGGLGAESFRTGPQVDNVVFLDVVTPDGTVQRCSSVEHSELFDAVRSGLGQCGIIVRAGYPIRRSGSRVRSLWLAYRDVARFMSAAERACMNPRTSFVSGAITRDPRKPQRRLLVLILGLEHDDDRELDSGTSMKSLEFDDMLTSTDVPTWAADGVPGHVFFRLYAPLPGSLDANPSTLHPWVDHVFERVAAARILSEHLDGSLPTLELGANALIFVRRGPCPAPLFVVPRSEHLLWGVGLFPSVTRTSADVWASAMLDYSRYGEALGGKRYLSGLIDFASAAQWQKHYGRRWRWFRDAKARFDPKFILNQGFLRWGTEG